MNSTAILIDAVFSFAVEALSKAFRTLQLVVKLGVRSSAYVLKTVGVQKLFTSG
jgi:hypothetical protein